VSVESVYAARAGRLVDRLRSEEVDLLWVSNLPNIRYLTGFTGSSAQLLVTPKESIFITDGRYREQVQSEVQGCRIRVFTKGFWTDVLNEEAGGASWKRVAYEGDHTSCNGLTKVQALPALRGDFEWFPTLGWVENLRLQKDETEIEALRRSSQVVDRVFEALLPEFRAGVTERQVLRKMMNLLWEHGATGPSFDPIVLFGARSSLPHGKPGDGVLAEGDWVLLDFGAVVEGYCSDCTRTFVFGKADKEQRERHAWVARAQEAGVAAAQPGTPCKEVDEAARKVLTDAGLGDAFIHGLGHGVGLEIHEGPRLASTSPDTLQEGMVVTIEPGVYLPGWGGIRIEDAVVVRSGVGEKLTSCDRSIDPSAG
jgi:Xaa-Pro dipeptidase